MKVEMEVAEGPLKTGMFFGKVQVFYVIVKAEFSEEEKAALKKSGAWEQVFFNFKLHPKEKYSYDNIDITVSNLIKNGGCNPYFMTSVDAHNAMEELEGQFRKLKNNIDSVSAPKTRSLQF